MVRNKTGGKNHKKMASKNEKVFVNKKIPLIKTHPDKNMLIYGIIEKVNGGGRFNIKCSDGKIRLLELRRKFGGRNKRDNTVKLNTIVLAGKRDWQIVRDKKLEKVDLIYVYNENDLPKLQKDVDYFDEHHLLGNIKEDDNGIDFTNNNDDIINNTTIKQKSTSIINEEDDTLKDFDFDDI
jgi:translation initiation factor IF-1